MNQKSAIGNNSEKLKTLHMDFIELAGEAESSDPQKRLEGLRTIIHDLRDLDSAFLKSAVGGKDIARTMMDISNLMSMDHPDLCTPLQPVYEETYAALRLKMNG